MYKIKCPYCGEIFPFNKENIKTDRCPKCDKRLYEIVQYYIALKKKREAESDNSANDAHYIDNNNNQDENVLKCPECGEKIAPGVDVCPNCGFPIKKRDYSKIIFLTAIVVIVVSIFFLIGSLLLSNTKLGLSDRDTDE